MLAAASPYPLLDGSEKCGKLHAEAQQPEAGLQGGLWTDSPDKSCRREILQLNRRPITRISKQALGLSTS